MTLQKLLFHLSNNKDVGVRCFCCDGQCIIEITESYTNRELQRVSLDLSSEITAASISNLLQYL